MNQRQQCIHLMEQTDIYNSFLTITRLGIDVGKGGSLSGRVNWNDLEALALQHGLSAILLDGIEHLPEIKRPPKLMLLQWIGSTLQLYEQRYAQYCRTIAEIARFYNTNGYKMMVLKGFVCSLDWPKPEHRPCGDIDIWLFGMQKEADSSLTKEKGIKIDTSEHHHTVFYWGDFMVENHYDFIEVHHHGSSPALEKILKDLGQDDSYYVELYGEKVYVPSPNLHALFLLRHMMEHFASSGITLRQLLDWGFFVKAHGREVDWGWLEDVLDEFGMKRLYDIFNAICVEQLGFDVNIFNRVLFEPQLKDRVLDDILSPEFSNEEPKGLLSRVLFKYKRWKANGWKQELCYKGSRWSAFWYATWNHILKPSSI